MTAPMTAPSSVTPRVFRAFAAGSVGTGGFGVLPGLVLAYYLTDTLGVAAWWATIVVLIPKAADVLVDPAIGRLSDRMALHHGDRSRLMKIGAIVLGPAFALTFCAPGATGPAPAAVWVIVFFVLSSIAFSLFQVPYIALPSELSADPVERTRLVSVRIAVLSASILAVGGGGPAIRDAVGGSAGYLAMGITVGATLSAGMLWTAYGAAPAGRTVPLDSAPAAAPAQVQTPTSDSSVNRRFTVLLASFVVQALGTAVILAAAQYAATYLLRSATAVTGLFAALVLPAVIVTGGWRRIARRRGRIRTYLLASAVYVTGAVLLFPAVGTSGAWVYAATVIVGIGYAGTQAMPLALLADILGGSTSPTGSRSGNAGVLAGLWTASETVAMALGPAIVLSVLGATGFISSTAGAGGDTVQVLQPDSALTGIALLFSAVPAVFVALGGLLIIRFRQLTPPEVDNVHTAHTTDSALITEPGSPR